MADPRVTDIVQYATSGDWSIPEFQREFEWRPDQVAMLCNSLQRNLPIGMLTVWNTTSYNEPQRTTPSGRTPYWIVDGQQRIISFCIISGRKPYWMDSTEWNDAFEKNRIFLNINEDGKVNLGRRSRTSKVQIPLDELIHKTAAEVQRYVQEKCRQAGVVDSDDAVNTAANSLQILERVVPKAEVSNDKAVEDVADLYRRLNQQGTRLRQAQIMLAYVSQYNRGWVRDEFYPLLQDLSSRDEWELDPAHVLQVATILAEGKARVGQASEDMWKFKVTQIWKPNLIDAIQEALLQLWEKGITDQDMIPSSYTIIALFAILAKFGAKPGFNFENVFKWFVLANLSGRYGDAPLETLTGDGHAIYEASNFDEVLEKLAISWTEEDLRKLLSQTFRDNSSQALLLHVLLWSAQAKDWVEGFSIPTLTQAPKKLEPHWHHIVPKVWGKNNGFENCDKTANVTRLCGKTNTRGPLKSKPPWQYVPESNINREALIQHLVPDTYAEKFTKGQPLSPDEFKDFLKKREELLVEQAASLLGI